MIIDYEDDGVIRWERFGEKKHAELIDLIEAYEDKQKHGRWKGAGMGDYMCSLCATVVSGNRYNYCPNCGARMDESEA